MALEKVGNLGQVQLMQRLVSQKSMKASVNQDKSIVLSEKEHKELESLLHDFQYVLSNLMTSENALKKDGYGGLVSVIEDVKKKDLY
ncbi:hypothetical protein [Bacillus pumilus]|uniref:hypothetical protein n=1 Tax=Bacillus pumilus TaxID=1408 RepID=UPI00119E1AD3|nr:hypothetical protein [Bacillus pumilus]